MSECLILLNGEIDGAVQPIVKQHGCLRVRPFAVPRRENELSSVYSMALNSPNAPLNYLTSKYADAW